MKNKNYFARMKSGRAFNGAHRDMGSIYHIVTTDSDPSWENALCGVSPGIKGNGWTSPEKDLHLVNCKKCLKKLEKINDKK